MLMVFQSEVAGFCDSTITFDHILDYAVFKNLWCLCINQGLWRRFLWDHHKYMSTRIKLIKLAEYNFPSLHSLRMLIMLNEKLLWNKIFPWFENRINCPNIIKKSSWWNLFHHDGCGMKLTWGEDVLSRKWLSHPPEEEPAINIAKIDDQESNCCLCYSFSWKVARNQKLCNTFVGHGSTDLNFPKMRILEVHYMVISVNANMWQLIMLCIVSHIFIWRTFGFATNKSEERRKIARAVLFCYKN